MENQSRWQQVARAVGLFDEAGTTRPTIFTQMSELAMRTGALNLGQGYPDDDAPATVTDVARAAIADGVNQYAPGVGIGPLREAIANHQQRHYGLELDPDTQIAVTNGATEGIAGAILALAGPGDEVLTLEPYYDSYAAVIAMAGATHTTVPFAVGADHRFVVDTDELRAAFNERTAVVLVNTPHNPTGAVLGSRELHVVAEAAAAHDVVVVTDEVYEHLIYDQARHIPIATLPGMFDRTLTISSAGKTFSVTGWKVGWVSGPQHLVEAVVAIKQFLTFSGGAPFQPAVTAALNLETTPGVEQGWIPTLQASLARRRDLLTAGLAEAGLPPNQPEGGFFVIADSSAWLERFDLPDGAALCRALPELAGVVAVPVNALTTRGSRADTDLSAAVRFTFAKSEPVITGGLERLVARWSAP